MSLRRILAAAASSLIPCPHHRFALLQLRHCLDSLFLSRAAALRVPFFCRIFFDPSKEDSFSILTFERDMNSVRIFLFFVVFSSWRTDKAQTQAYHTSGVHVVLLLLSENHLFHQVVAGSRLNTPKAVRIAATDFSVRGLNRIVFLNIRLAIISHQISNRENRNTIRNLLKCSLHCMTQAVFCDSTSAHVS